MRHRDRRRRGHIGSPQNCHSVAQDKFFAQVALDVDIMNQVRQTNHERLSDFSESAHANVADVVNFETRFRKASQSIEKESAQAKELHVFVNLIFDMREVLVAKPVHLVLERNPKEADVSNQIAPDGFDLFRIGDVDVLKARLDVAGRKVFVCVALAKCSDLRLRQRADDDDVGLESARDRVNVVLETCPDFRFFDGAIICKDDVGLNRDRHARVKRLKSLVGDFFRAHCEVDIPDGESANVQRVLKKVSVRGRVGLLAHASDRPRPIERRLVVHHQKLGRNPETPANAPLAQEAARIVRPVHELLGERRGNPGRRLARLNVFTDRRPPNASEHEDRHEDLCKLKRCARVVDLHRVLVWLIGQPRLEVFDGNVGKRIGHVVIARRERVLPLATD